MKFILDVLPGNGDLLSLQLVRIEGNFIQEPLHHSVQPSGANVLCARVYVVGDLGHFLYGVLFVDKFNPLGGHQCFILNG